MYFSVNKKVHDIKIQLYDKAGQTSKISTFEINPRYFNFSFSSIFSFITVLLMLVLAFGLFLYRKALKVILKYLKSTKAY